MARGWLKVGAAGLCACSILCAGGPRDDFARAARSIGGRVGVSAVLVETGEHAAFNGGQRFFMASTVKFPTALSLLALVDDGKLRLDDKVPVTAADRAPGVTALGGNFQSGAEFTVRQLLRYMMIDSDNTAFDALLRVCGGPPAVMARLQALGISGIHVDRGDKQIAASYARSRAKFMKDGRDTATPDAMAALLAKFQQGETLRPATTALLREMMEDATAFTNRLKGLLPPGTEVAHKTGTWGEAATNDVGIITLPGGARHIAIAVYTSGSKKKLDAVERAIAEIGRAAYDYWAGSAR